MVVWYDPQYRIAYLCRFHKIGLFSACLNQSFKTAVFVYSILSKSASSCHFFGITAWSDGCEESRLVIFYSPILFQRFMGCLHDPANVQQTSSKCIQNTRANAGRLLEVCWKFAGRLLPYVLMKLDVCWIV